MKQRYKIIKIPQTMRFVIHLILSFVAAEEGMGKIIDEGRSYIKEIDKILSQNSNLLNRTDLSAKIAN